MSSIKAQILLASTDCAEPVSQLKQCKVHWQLNILTPCCRMKSGYLSMQDADCIRSWLGEAPTALPLRLGWGILAAVMQCWAWMHQTPEFILQAMAARPVWEAAPWLRLRVWTMRNVSTQPTCSARCQHSLTQCTLAGGALSTLPVIYSTVMGRNTPEVMSQIVCEQLIRKSKTFLVYLRLKAELWPGRQQQARCILNQACRRKLTDRQSALCWFGATTWSRRLFWNNQAGILARLVLRRKCVPWKSWPRHRQQSRA